MVPLSPILRIVAVGELQNRHKNIPRQYVGGWQALTSYQTSPHSVGPAEKGLKCSFPRKTAHLPILTYLP